VVELVHERARLLVRVADDGVGGVVVTAGSGLRGLQDRLAAVDGTLFIDSPPGAGTRLEARIPCAALPGAEGPAAVLDEARA
jgi:signal transduction histidine kinase